MTCFRVLHEYRMCCWRDIRLPLRLETDVPNKIFTVPTWHMWRCFPAKRIWTTLSKRKNIIDFKGHTLHTLIKRKKLEQKRLQNALTNQQLPVCEGFLQSPQNCKNDFLQIHRLYIMAIHLLFLAGKLILNDEKRDIHFLHPNHKS